MRDYKEKFREACVDHIRRIKIIDQIAFIAIVIIMPVALVIWAVIDSSKSLEFFYVKIHGFIIVGVVLYTLFILISFRLYQHIRFFYCKRLSNSARNFTSGYAIDLVDALRRSYFPTISREFIDQLNVLMREENWLDYKTFEFDATGMVFDYQTNKEDVLMLESHGWHYYLTGWTYGAHLDGFIFTFDKRPIGGNGPIEQVTYYIHRAE
jgi:hypothetical protein